MGLGLRVSGSKRVKRGCHRDLGIEAFDRDPTAN